MLHPNSFMRVTLLPPGGGGRVDIQRDWLVLVFYSLTVKKLAEVFQKQKTPSKKLTAFDTQLSTVQ